VLAHELAHTLQNATGAHRSVDTSGAQSAAGERLTATAQATQPTPSAPFPIRRAAGPATPDTDQDEDYQDLGIDQVDWDEAAAVTAKYGPGSSESVPGWMDD
jgi:hypothetical protein